MQLENSTVGPPNNGQVGDDHSVHCSEVVPYSEVEMYGQYYIDRGQTVGRGCPLFRACIIGASTVFIRTSDDVNMV